MIIKLKLDATEENIAFFKEELMSKYLLTGNVLRSDKNCLIQILGDTTRLSSNHFDAYEFVESGRMIEEPYKLARKKHALDKTIINVNGVEFGGSEAIVIAGPCAVESQEQISSIASFVASKGAQVLRGGISKPRTSPYAFQGFKEQGIRFIENAKSESGLLTICEIVSAEQIDEYFDVVDIYQVGARNMYNYELLKALSKTDKPVLLKRGMSATIEEWLLAAEYILAGGNSKVMLCERGIRTFETEYRNVMDINGVVALKHLTHLPIIVDPSHGCGKWWMVNDLAKAAVMVGADGIMVEVHNHPEDALSDGFQSLRFDNFSELMEDVAKINAIR